MNTCDKTPFYLYNEMNEQEKKEFEEHLLTCRECKDSIKTFAAVKDSMQLVSAPLQIINAIFERTTRRKTFSFANIAKTWKVTAAIAAGLIVGVCTFSLKEFSPKNSSYYYAVASYTETLEEIESIDSYLDEMENYYFMV